MTTANQSLVDQTDFRAVLQQAAAAYRGDRPFAERPAAVQVVDALLQAEKSTKQGRSLISVQDLLGKWRLCFIADRAAHKLGQNQGKGRYIPKFLPIASIEFSELENEAVGAIANQIQFGSFIFKLSGSFNYPNTKNLLAFDFAQMQFSLFGKSIYQGTFPNSKILTTPVSELAIAKLPFFAFFLATETCIAARGRGGGLALWVKEGGGEGF
jgi:hypothetical protein